MKIGNLNEPYVNYIGGETLWYSPPVTQEFVDALPEDAPDVKVQDGTPWCHKNVIVTVLCVNENAENSMEATEASILAKNIFEAEEEVDVTAPEVQLIRKMALAMEKLPTMCRGPLESELKLAETITTSADPADGE